MKTLLTTLLFTLLFPFNLSAQDKSADDLIVEGIYQEEVLGNLDKAAELFNQVLKDFSNDRKECAQATYHLGLIAEKGENGKKAKGFYNRILEEYREVGVYADLSRNRLEKINNKNTFIDPRDGHKYKWVKIGDQVWMAENLAFMPWVNPPKKQEYGIWVYDYEGEDVAEAKATENYQKYGCLYDWPTGMGLGTEYLTKEWGGDPENHQGLCPPEWRMPSDKDWMELEGFLGMPDSVLILEGGNRAGKYDLSYKSYDYPPVGSYLKSTTGWISGSNGSNSTNFKGLPAGYRSPPRALVRGYNREFDQLGEVSGFLSSTEYIETYKEETYYEAIGRYLYKQKPEDFERDLWMGRETGFSIRCIKNVKQVKPDDYNTRRIPKIETSISANIQKVISKNEIDSERLLKSSEISNTDDWTKFGKDLHNTGFAESSILLSKHKNTMVWLKGIEIFSVSVANKIAYCQGKDSTMYALDLTNGTIVWKFKAEAQLVGPPTLSHDLIIFASNLGPRRNSKIPSGTKYLYALDIESGEIRWKIKKGAEAAWSPGIIGDTLYIGLGKDFLALDVFTGSQFWKFSIDVERAGVYSGIAFYNNLAIFGTSTKVLAVNLETKLLEWEFETNRPTFSTPTILNGIVFFGGSDNYFYALNARTGEKLWGFFTNSRNNWDSPAAANSYVFFGSGDNNFYALDIQTGIVSWKYYQKDQVWANTHPALTKDFVVIGLRDNLLLALDTSDGNILWKYAEDQATRFINPIIYKDKIISGSSEGLYVFTFETEE